MIPYFYNMALLSKTEKLICEARSCNDEILNLAYKLSTIYIEANAVLENRNEEIKFFYYLYTKNHEGLSYDYIAQHVLFTSVSTLEDRRNKFKNIFIYFVEKAKESASLLNEAAITVNN